MWQPCRVKMISFASLRKGLSYKPAEESVDHVLILEHEIYTTKFLPKIYRLGGDVESLFGTLRFAASSGRYVYWQEFIFVFECMLAAKVAK
jgi:hypothetical protein